MTGGDVDALLSLVHAALGSHPYGFLATTGDGGVPHARLVQHVAVEADLTLWFGTSPASGKVRELRRSPRATYAVENRPSFAAASLTGNVTIVDDPAARRSHWADGFDAFFPAGPTGEDYVALKLVPEEVELIDFAHGVHPTPYGLASQRLTRDQGHWQVAP